MNYILYFVYVIFFGCMFLTNDFVLTYNFFVCVVAPISLLPICFSDINDAREIRWHVLKFSFNNPLKTLAPARAQIFFGVLGFGLALILSSSLTPTISLEWFRIFAGYLIAICLFVLITARLLIAFEDFCGAFFTCFCSIVATNAAINIYIYFHALNNLADFASVRLAPSFGHAPDHYFTTAALAYAVAFSGAVGLLVSETNRLRRLIGFLSSIVLFVAICLTQSRGPLLAASVAILVAGLLGWGRSQRWLYVIIPIVAVGIFMLIPEFSKSFILRADNHRIEIWRKFIQFALERPILGYGERILIYLEISDGERLGHGHNIFISALMRGGLFALSGIVFTYASSLAWALKFDLSNHKPIPLALLLTIFLSGLVDFDQIVMLSDWQWPSFWLPLGLALGAEHLVKNNRFSFVC
jgi:O-antigen ligase